MPTFNHAETFACQRLIQLALDEDLNGQTDLTSEATIPAELTSQAVYVARASGTLAGLPAAALVLQAVDPQLRFQPLVEDGSAVERGTRLATVAGPMRSLLTAERTSLNFLQRLSGVATQTRRYVDVVSGLRCRILDTRKTTPGWRLLEKYAVRCGGGHNHRLGLYDGILIKDNHLAALPGRDRRGQIEEALNRARAAVGAAGSVEIEVDDLEQLDVALAHGPNIILLDNMNPETMREAVRRRAARAPSVLLEASGGITLETLRAVGETGVDRISVGALTHSAIALDVALDWTP